MDDLSQNVKSQRKVVLRAVTPDRIAPVTGDNDPPDFALANRFRAALEASGLKQYQAEEAAEVSVGHLSRVLSGERVELRASTMAAYAVALGVEERWLARGEGPMRTEQTPPPGGRAGASVTRVPPEPRRARQGMQVHVHEGRWKTFSYSEPQFRRLATARLATAQDEHHRKLVEAALDMAADAAPMHYGGRVEPLTWAEVKELYNQAWADMHDDPPAPAPAAPPPAPPPGPSMKERVAALKKKR